MVNALLIEQFLVAITPPHFVCLGDGRSTRLSEFRGKTSASFTVTAHGGSSLGKAYFFADLL